MSDIIWMLWSLFSHSVVSDSLWPLWTGVKLMSIESVMPSNHLVLCCPLLLLPLSFPSLRVFSNESALHIRGPSIGASALVLPMNIQDWFPLGLTGLISLQPRELYSTVVTSQIYRDKITELSPPLKSSPLIFHLVILFTADLCLNQLIHWGQKKKKKRMVF